MIEQQDAMILLVKACPSFGKEWVKHLHEHGNDLPYTAAGAFARHLLSLYQAGNLSSFQDIAVAIERLYTEGSPWVKEFATIGVLESIQNAWSHSSANPEEFANFLFPESQRWWRSLRKFWSGAIPHITPDA